MGLVGSGEGEGAPSVSAAAEGTEGADGAAKAEPARANTASPTSKKRTEERKRDAMSEPSNCLRS
jgi:hypothetical protein